jgi:hypothetical protein
MKIILSLFCICFSLYAVLFSFSNTEDGRKYEVYNFEIIANEYKMASKNGADERALTHIFNRRYIIGGVKSLVISLFNIDGYKSASDNFDTFNQYYMLQSSN